MTIQSLYKISEQYQQALEKIVANPSGTCHLAAHCIAENLKNKGLNAISVTGHLTLRDKNEKLLFYSSRNPDIERNVGFYHSWCEVTMDSKQIIVDASLKYNIKFLKKYKKKVHPKIPPLLITHNSNTYYWKYKKDDTLRYLSDRELNQIQERLITRLVESF